MISGALQTVDQLADLVWAGFIGSRAIASIGVAQSWSQLVMTARMGLDTSARAMIARAVGAGNISLANHIARQSFLLNGGASLFMTVRLLIYFPYFLWGPRLRKKVL